MFIKNKFIYNYIYKSIYDQNNQFDLIEKIKIWLKKIDKFQIYHKINN